MKKQYKLPETRQELDCMCFDDKALLWSKYSPHPYKRQIRSLWYYIQCDRLKLRIEPKFLVKIKKYKDNPESCINAVYKHRYNLSPGMVITKYFRGIEHKIMVNDDRTFIYNNHQFKTLSSVAKEISSIKISGPDFFGLTKRQNHDN